MPPNFRTPIGPDPDPDETYTPPRAHAGPLLVALCLLVFVEAIAFALVIAWEVTG